MKVARIETNPDKQMLQEMVERLTRAHEKVWDAQRELGDATYEVTKFVFERGWYECLKLDEAKMRRMAR